MSSALLCWTCKKRIEDRKDHAHLRHDYETCSKAYDKTGEVTVGCGGCRGDGMDCMYESLAICKACGGSEGSLLPECPGRRLTYEEDQVNYKAYCDGTGPFKVTNVLRGY